MPDETRHCCEQFAQHATGLTSESPLAIAYPPSMRLDTQFARENDTWNIVGCCGGGCFVVTDMRYCPFCGTQL